MRIVFWASFSAMVGCAHSKTPLPLASATDAGWTRLEGGPQLQGNQDDLWCFDVDRCIAVNSAGVIRRTVNGGADWTVLLDQPGTFFRAIAFLDEDVGLVSNLGPGLSPHTTDSQVLYRTVDAGQTWSAVQGIDSRVPGVCNLHVVDEQSVWASGRVSGPSWVGRSVDQGLTWTWMDLHQQLEQVIDLEFADRDTGIVIGSFEGRGRVLRTTDGGGSWSVVWEGQRADELPWKISFPTADVGYIGVQYRGVAGETRLLKTTDGGASWLASRALNRPYGVKGVGFVSEDVGWIAGEGQAYQTVDGGRTWAAVDGLYAGVNRFRFFPESGVGYAIGTNVWKWTSPTP